jgi:hypothetical protein
MSFIPSIEHKDLTEPRKLLRDLNGRKSEDNPTQEALARADSRHGSQFACDTRSRPISWTVD